MDWNVILSLRATQQIAYAALLLSACEVSSRCPRALLTPPSREARYAVVTSDQGTTTAIALLDADATLITEAFVDSATAANDLTASLTGDVSLPSSVVVEGALLTIDRRGRDVVSRFAFAPSDVTQWSVFGDRRMGRGGFLPNPQDVVLIGADRALISRFDPNLDPSAPEIDRGDDLVELDMNGAQSLTRRIDLEVLRVREPTRTFYARPTQLVRLGRYVVIGAGRLANGFREVAPGAVGVLDLETSVVTRVDLPELSNCGNVTAVPASDGAAQTRAIVLCSGATFEADRRAQSGIALIEVGAATRVVHTVRSRDAANARPFTYSATSLGDTRVVAVSLGDLLMGEPDRLYDIDLATGVTSELYRSTDPAINTLGRILYDAKRRVLLVPHASEGVLKFNVGADRVIALQGVVRVSPCRGLPAREVALLLR